jgi:hypothetical protein
MGFREIPRREFLARLADAGRSPVDSGHWQAAADVMTIADWQPQ